MRGLTSDGLINFVVPTTKRITRLNLRVHGQNYCFETGQKTTLYPQKRRGLISLGPMVFDIPFKSALTTEPYGYCSLRCFKISESAPFPPACLSRTRFRLEVNRRTSQE